MQRSWGNRSTKEPKASDTRGFQGKQKKNTDRLTKTIPPEKIPARHPSNKGERWEIFPCDKMKKFGQKSDHLSTYQVDICIHLYTSRLKT